MPYQALGLQVLAVCKAKLDIADLSIGTESSSFGLDEARQGRRRQREITSRGDALPCVLTNYLRMQGPPLKAGDLLPLTDGAAKLQAGNSVPKAWLLA